MDKGRTKWTKGQRKLMTMHKALYPRDVVDRIYVSRKEGKRKLASVEDCIDKSIQGLEVYIKKSKKRFIPAASNIIGNKNKGKQ